MKKVQVLLSTYNGEKYLKEQLDSIIAQKGVDVHILARDDGSKDDTIKILEGYENIDIIKGSNIGVCKSFFELINKSGEYDYYSFADQDDVWDCDKLVIAINKLEKCNSKPAVYASNTRLVDANLTFLKCDDDNPKTTLGSAFVKNYCTGCTMVFNKQLMKYLKNNLPEYAPMHDWWVNLVCLSIGGVSLYDQKPHMNYRQHGNNVLGAEKNPILKAQNRWSKFRNESYHRDIMAKELANKYSTVMTRETLEVVNVLGDEKRRLINIIKNKCIKTGCLSVDFLFIILVIFKKI